MNCLLDEQPNERPQWIKIGCFANDRNGPKAAITEMAGVSGKRAPSFVAFRGRHRRSGTLLMCGEQR
jgi:hypothetical protein